MAETTSRGGESVEEPRTLSDAQGEVKVASIATYGHTIHTFVERRNYTGVFLPGYAAVKDEDESAVRSGCCTLITWWAMWRLGT